MIANLLKTHLPWAAPSVAIALAVSGVFDRSATGSTHQNTQVQFAAVQSPQDDAAGFDDNEVSQTTNIATSLNSLAVAGTLTQENAATNDQLTLVVAAAPEPIEAPAPAVAPVAAATLQTDDPGGFFAATQANLATKTSCVEDLRNLTLQARVYFPNGGLQAESRGIGQARLIGLVAQDCPGIQINVKGHSDASGSPQANLILSERRAKSIIERISSSGVDTSMFFASGYGQTVPSTVRGERPTSYYDRRVEFELIENNRTASLSVLEPSPVQKTVPSCVEELRADIENTKVFFSPRSITSSYADFTAALSLATRTQACPQVRLRVIGQHSDRAESGENSATGRLRAAALMGALVNEGVDPGQIIVAAPSWSQKVPGKPGLSSHRIDFELILEDG